MTTFTVVRDDTQDTIERWSLNLSDSTGDSALCLIMPATEGERSLFEGSWKTWFGGTVYANLIELIDHVAEMNGIADYLVDATAIEEVAT